jgi:hypothetical protein
MSCSTPSSRASSRSPSRSSSRTGCGMTTVAVSSQRVSPSTSTTPNRPSGSTPRQEPGSGRVRPAGLIGGGDHGVLEPAPPGRVRPDRGHHRGRDRHRPEHPALDRGVALSLVPGQPAPERQQTLGRGRRSRRLGTRFSGLPLEVRQTRVPLAMSRASSYPPMACTQTGASAVAVVVREVLMDRLLCEMHYPGPESNTCSVTQLGPTHTSVTASFRRAADQSEPVQVTAVTAAGRCRLETNDCD